LPSGIDASVSRQAHTTVPSHSTAVDRHNWAHQLRTKESSRGAGGPGRTLSFKSTAACFNLASRAYDRRFLSRSLIFDNTE